MTFEEVGETIGRTPAACRQLGSRARRHVEARRPRFDPDAQEQRRVVSAFLDASARGDLEALLRVLDPTVVLRADGGGKVRMASKPVAGAEPVAKVLLAGAREYPATRARPIAVNGGTGALLTFEGAVLAVVAVTVSRGLITEVDLVANPDKLHRTPLERGIPE